MEENRLCRCDNCSWTGRETELGCDLLSVPDLNERLDPGSVVPVGECPECGCLAYLGEEEEEPCTVRHTVCKHCHLDVEGFAPFNEQTEWRDRGNNTECPNDEGVRHEGVL